MPERDAVPPSAWRQPDELLLWKQFKAGDHAAFTALYGLYSTPLFKYGMTLVYNRERVKEALQELFVELWQRRENLSDVKSVRFYLLISLRRMILRKGTTVSIPFGLEALDYHSSPDAVEHSPEHSFIAGQTDTHRRNCLSRAIENLPRRQKEAIYLRFYQQMSYEEITEAMDLDYQVVRNLMYKGIKHLRTKLAGHVELFLLMAFSHLLL